MKPPHEGRDEMRNGAELRGRRRGDKAPRAETLSELPLVTAFLVMAVVVAVMAAGSIAGSFLGAVLLGAVPAVVLLPALAAILLISAVQVWRHA